MSKWHIMIISEAHRTKPKLMSPKPQAHVRLCTHIEFNLALFAHGSFHRFTFLPFLNPANQRQDVFSIKWAQVMLQTYGKSQQCVCVKCYPCFLLSPQRFCYMYFDSNIMFKICWVLMFSAQRKHLKMVGYNYWSNRKMWRKKDIANQWAVLVLCV